MAVTAEEIAKAVPVEKIPDLVRGGGEGRQAVKWEELLVPFKAKDKAGKPFRLWLYEKRTAAVSRKAAITNRLVAQVPSENWTIEVRPIEDKFGVFIQFNGLFTDAQVKENAVKREARLAKVRAARAATAQADQAMNGGDAAKVAAAATR